MNKQQREERLLIAQQSLSVCRSAFKSADTNAVKTLKLVLRPAGEDGVPLCPVDYTGGYVPLSEEEPQQIKPITRIRFWKDKLEVFVANYKPCEDKDGWELLPDGKWIDYEDAKTDTWFVIDCVLENLEYANGYQEDE